MTAKELMEYFEKEFVKKMDALLDENKEDEEYTTEDAREEATGYFTNECKDYKAIAGLYVGDASGNPKKALRTFREEIDGDPSEYDRGVMKELKKAIEGEKSERARSTELLRVVKVIEHTGLCCQDNVPEVTDLALGAYDDCISAIKADIVFNYNSQEDSGSKLTEVEGEEICGREDLDDALYSFFDYEESKRSFEIMLEADDLYSSCYHITYKIEPLYDKEKERRA